MHPSWSCIPLHQQGTGQGLHATAMAVAAVMVAGFLPGAGSVCVDVDRPEPVFLDLPCEMYVTDTLTLCENGAASEDWLNLGLTEDDFANSGAGQDCCVCGGGQHDGT